MKDGVKEASYDESADLYDAAFADIKVRELEWEFLAGELRRVSAGLGRLPRVLEIGCGNGQMLRQLLEEELIAEGVGLDCSEGMLARARARQGGVSGVRFEKIDGSVVDLPDGSVDVVISFLSFRYLDWGPICDEIARVGGEFLMVDMATTRLREEERPLYEETRARTQRLHASRPEFAKALQELVNHPAWHRMLKSHPRREAAEYEEFLTSRFPKGEWKRLYLCFDHSLFAFSTIL